jgi:hypothetical protein
MGCATGIDAVLRRADARQQEEAAGATHQRAEE